MQIFSVSNSQHEILHSITRLYLGNKPFDLDLCYGRGNLYNDTVFPVDTPIRINDKNETGHRKLTNFDCRKIPLANETQNTIMYDPPFLAGNMDYTMLKRYGGFKHPQDIFDFQDQSLAEIARILRKGGYLVTKIQDFTHGNQKFFPSVYQVNKAKELELYLEDSFVFINKNRFRAKTAGINNSISAHCFFHVFKKGQRKKRINRY